MRKRFPVSTHLEFQDALKAKRDNQEKSPDKNFQIRRYKNGFRLVERLSSTEAGLVKEMRKPKKKKGFSYAP